MVIEYKKCSDTELWELLGDICKVLDTKEQDKTSVVYMTWAKMFNLIRKEIDKRLRANQ